MAECSSCGGTIGLTDKTIDCGSCINIAHLKCAFLSGVKSENIKHINWSCNTCFNRVKRLEKDIMEIKLMLAKQQSEMEKKVDKLQEQIKEVVGEGMQDVVSELGAAISTDSTLDQHSSWVDVVKRKKKKTEKKNLLVVKSTDESKKVVDKKKEVAQALDGTQIVDTRFTQKGDIVMNFEDEKKRDEAVQKLGNVSDVITSNVRKLKPKIMICNVNREEESGDKIIENLVDRNGCLQGITDARSKMELMFSKPASGGTMHYVIKCDPEIRELIRKNQDQVKLEWGVYYVRDRYMVTACYHCQRFGHITSRCASLTKGEDPVCAKCAGNHKTKDCQSAEKKCINCMRFKKSDCRHAATEMGHCHVLQDEIGRVKRLTENGY